MPMSFWRPEFEAALAKMAEVSSAMDAQGLNPPILVGVLRLSFTRWER